MAVNIFTFVMNLHLKNMHPPGQPLTESVERVLQFDNTDNTVQFCVNL